MTCNHKWDVGTAVWIDDIPKIKTKCLICRENILVDFKPDWIYSDDKLTQEELKKERKK